MSEAFEATPHALLDASVSRGEHTNTHTQSRKGYNRQIAKQAGKAEGGEGGRRPQAEILGRALFIYAKPHPFSRAVTHEARQARSFPANNFRL